MTRLAPLAAFAVLLLAPAAAHAQASPSPFTSATRYDGAGRVTGTISADPDGVGTGNPFLAVRNTYDGAGRLTRVETGTLTSWQSESVAPSAWTTFSVDRTAETSYDAMGRKLRETLREGAAGTVRTLTQYSYDSAGRLDCTAIRMNPALYGSLPASACVQATPAGGDGPDRITRSFYDVADQRLQLREGVGVAGVEGAEASWDYNLDGQVTTVIDGNGNRAQLVYDGHGRQECWMFPSTTRAGSFNDATQATALATSGAISGTVSGGHCTSGNYERYLTDPAGNRTELRKRDTRRIQYAYDHLNRITQKTYPDGGATAVYYGYDLRNLQLFARYTSISGQGVTSGYDGFGRLASQGSDMSGTARTLSYLYDPDGNRTRITHPDGQNFTTVYDGLNRPYSLSDTLGRAIYYTWKDHGALYGTIRTNGVGNYREYDGVQRLYSHGLYHPATYSWANVLWVYGYNAASGISSIVRDNDNYAWTGHYAVQRPYTTNGRNQYINTGSGSVTTFGYDDNGNLTSETPPSPAPAKSYGYDIENRLVSVSAGGVTLSYDPLGRLFQVSSTSGPTTQFLYDGDALVAEYVSGAMTQRYLHNVGADVPMVSYAGSALATPSWLHADHQGSIVSLTDAYGASSAINRYDEYGIPASINTGRFQYTGQIWLPELGMYHYKARVYSPTLGRFLQTDPVGYQDQFNLYAYAGNDPINFTDPSGTAILGPALQGAREMVLQNINGRSQDQYDWRGRQHVLTLVQSNVHPERSRYYSDRINQGIAARGVIQIRVAERFKAGNHAQETVSSHGGEATYVTRTANGQLDGQPTEVTMYLNGRGGEIRDAAGNRIPDDGADAVAHGLTGHAIPLIAGSDTGNAVENANRVRAENSEPLRAPDRCHVEDKRQLPTGCTSGE